MNFSSGQGLIHRQTAKTFAVGLTAGLFGSLMGLGGGVVMIPMMVGLCKLPQHQAHGTSLVALVLTGTAGGLAYGIHHQVDLTAALFLALAALWPAQWGARCCHRLNEHRLRVVFGIFLVGMAVLIVLKPFLIPLDVPPQGWLKAAILITIGAATGFVSGLLGIGGGALMVTALVILCGYSQHLAQGSALMAMIPSGFVGGYAHWRLGGVATSPLKGLLPGILLGAFTGGALAQPIPESALRVLFGIALFWIGMRMALKRGSAACTEGAVPAP